MFDSRNQIVFLYMEREVHMYSGSLTVDVLQSWFTFVSVSPFLANKSAVFAAVSPMVPPPPKSLHEVTRIISSKFV